MPEKRGGNNPRIFNTSWFVNRPAVPYYKALPPNHPPPSRLLPSLNAPQPDFTFSTSTSQLSLLAVNKSLMPSASTFFSLAKSAPVTLKAAPQQHKD